MPKTKVEATRQVEIAYLYEDGTWSTDFVEVPEKLGNDREAIVSWVERYRLPKDTVAAQLYSITT